MRDVGCTCCVIVSLWEIELATGDQIIDEIVCISLYVNTLGKGMNPIIFSTAMGK